MLKNKLFLKVSTLTLLLLSPFHAKVFAEDLTYPLSGAPANTSAEVNLRPLAVMIDNHPNARLQAGLSQADLIFEYQVEGPYTRYMAVFQSQQPESIGPIRSARPYFVETAHDLNAIYTHFGGSTEGNQMIKDLKVNDIDGMTAPSSAIWRYNDTGKSAPHNAYASDQSLRNEAKSQGYSKESDIRFNKFNEQFTPNNGEAALNITIQFSNDNVSQFTYNQDTHKYAYTKDEKLQTDEFNKMPIEPTNIIVHQADFVPIPNQTTYTLDQNGEGNALFFTGGTVLPITYTKSEGENYKYYLKDGKELSLNPGQTWIAFTKMNAAINYQASGSKDAPVYY